MKFHNIFDTGNEILSRAMKMARVRMLDAASSQGEAARALASKVGHMGVFRALAHATTLIIPLMRLGQAILEDQMLDDRRRELLILLAMQLEGGDYEWRQPVDIALGVGATQAEITAVAALDLDSAVFDAADRALLAFGRAVVEEVRVPAAIFETVRAQLSQREIVEAIVAIGFYMTLARVTEGLEVAPDPVQGMAVFESSLRRGSPRPAVSE